MLKEIKYILFIFLIFQFLFFIGRYYFSENYKKKSYRSLNNINEKINTYAEKLHILESDTENIIEYVDQSKEKKKKKFKFWKLINSDE